MLSLSVCVKCWERHNHYFAFTGRVTEKTILNGELGEIVCPSELDTKVIGYSIKKAPPRHCPYKFEHAVGVSVKG